MTSPVVQVLTTAELLDAIFQLLDHKSNTSNATVCRKWSDVALDILWYEVSNPARLFSILAPLELESYHSKVYKFTRKLQVSDWEKLDRYRFRIKRLSYRSETRKSLVDEKAFNLVGVSRMNSAILPNLHTLEWDDQSSRTGLFIMFAHENIKQFITKLREEECPHLLPYVAERMPNITHFNCQSADVYSDISSHLTALLPCLRKLKELCLSPLCFTTAIAEAAADLQNLEGICMGYENPYCRVVDLHPQLKEWAYPSLSKLEICVTFQLASPFLLTLPTRANLKNIRIQSSIWEETPADFAHLITVIVSNCQRLQSLTLTGSEDEPRADDEHGILAERDRVSVDHLRPLFMLQNLIHFEISHQYPILLQPSDIEEIATSMPNIETFILNNKPTFMKDSELNLDALFPFARHCSRLHTLGLFINAAVDDQQYLLNPDPKYPVFSELRCLSVGYSAIEDIHRVAWLLSLISPKLCVIESTRTRGVPESRHKMWQEAASLLPLLKKMRMDEKERVKLLTTNV